MDTRYSESLDSVMRPLGGLAMSPVGRSAIADTREVLTRLVHLATDSNGSHECRERALITLRCLAQDDRCRAFTLDAQRSLVSSAATCTRNPELLAMVLAAAAVEPVAGGGGFIVRTCPAGHTLLDYRKLEGGGEYVSPYLRLLLICFELILPFILPYSNLSLFSRLAIVSNLKCTSHLCAPLCRYCDHCGENIVIAAVGVQACKELCDYRVCGGCVAMSRGAGIME